MEGYTLGSASELNSVFLSCRNHLFLINGSSSVFVGFVKLKMVIMRPCHFETWFKSS